MLCVVAVFLSLSQLVLADDMTPCKPGEIGCNAEKSSGRSLLQSRHRSDTQTAMFEGAENMIEKDGAFHGTIAGANLAVHADAPAVYGEEQDWIILQDRPCTKQDIQHFETSLGHDAVEKWHGHGDSGLCALTVAATLKDLQTVIHNSGGAWSSPHTYVETESQTYGETEVEEFSASQKVPVPWNLDRIDDREGQDGSYAVPAGGDGVRVYVLDTGVRDTHAEFEGRAKRWADPVNKDKLSLSNDALCGTNPHPDCALDDQGHGSHCAGTVAGKHVGVAPEATVWAIKVLSAEGTGRSSHIIAGLDLVASEGQMPAVVSMSIGSKSTSKSMRLAIEAVVNFGIPVVVSAGNMNDGEGPWDACSRGYGFVEAAITVGSSNQDDERSSFSNFGKCIDIFAPGSDIVSASHEGDGKYETFSGTSMATPAVAGAAARLLSLDKSADVAQQLDALATKNKLGNLKDGPNKLLFIDASNEVYRKKIVIGKSSGQKKCVKHQHVICPEDAGDKGIRVNSDYSNAKDAFEISVTTSGKTTSGKITTVCASQKDKNKGWNMNLEIECQVSGVLFDRGPGWDPKGQSQVCMGDCDKDSDCQEGLKCFQRSGKITSVPGCSGKPSKDWDYCYNPGIAQLVDGGWSPKGLLQVCMGDCDKDSDCQEGLECFQRDGYFPIPGCSGTGKNKYDYCYNPKLR